MQFRLRFNGLGLGIVCAILGAVESPAAAGETSLSAAEACALLDSAEVERVTGQKMYGEPTPMSLKGGAGALCGFDNTQVIIFKGKDSERLWNNFLEGFGYGGVQKHPMPNLGDRAYSFRFVPENKYQDAGTFIVVLNSERTFAVSVSAEEGEPPQSTEAKAVELAKIVLTKLP